MLKGGHHSKETIQKMQDMRKGKRPNLGKHFSEEHKRKIGLANKGKHRSEKEKQNLRQINTGKHHTEETKQKLSKISKGCTPWNKGKINIFSEESLEKIRKAHKGIMPKNMQRPGKWRNIERGYFNINGKEIFFRSKWEANYALYLDFLIKQKQIKKWAYEEDIFIFEKIKFGTRSYRPDFKIYNLDNTFEYHEVKGYMDDKSKTKIKRMAKYYPDIKLIIIDQYVYRDIKNKLGKMLKFY